MAERILEENKHVQTVSYSLPNKHYIPVDMRYAGIDNLTPYVSFILSLFPLCLRLALLPSSIAVDVSWMRRTASWCSTGLFLICDSLIARGSPAWVILLVPRLHWRG